MDHPHSYSLHSSEVTTKVFIKNFNGHLPFKSRRICDADYRYVRNTETELSCQGVSYWAE